VSYYRIESEQERLVCLADWYPFVFGIELFESFNSVSETGIVPMPDPTKEKFLGGHAMLCVGYNLKTKMYIVRNSWSTGWGDNGYCYIPFEYMDKFGADMWTIRK